jgi:hypothetical protein
MMPGTLRNAESVLTAARVSLNVIAETLLDPIISACAERLRIKSSRKVYWSYAKKAIQAESKAATLTSAFIQVSFFEIADCRRSNIIAPPRV